MSNPLRFDVYVSAQIPSSLTTCRLACLNGDGPRYRQRSFQVSGMLYWSIRSSPWSKTERWLTGSQQAART